MPGPDTPFSPLWIDKPDADVILQRKVALEDVSPGSGELIYYPGSHKLDDFLFGDEQSKAWIPASHGREIHRGFGSSIVTHYCPVDVAPKFSTFTTYFHMRKVF